MRAGISVLAWPIIPTRCRCRGLLFNLITFSLPPSLSLSLSHRHTHTHTHTHSRYDSYGRRISSSHRPLPDKTQHSQQTDMLPAVFEPVFAASKRPQTRALHRTATGISRWYFLKIKYSFFFFVNFTKHPPLCFRISSNPFPNKRQSNNKKWTNAPAESLEQFFA
jgi:hypothetical protein